MRAPTGDAVVDATADVARRVRGYLWAVTVTSLIAGAAAGLFAWAVGLDGALTWALVTFRGWVWGVVGALLAVPLTVPVAAVCERFGRARWIAGMLGNA